MTQKQKSPDDNDTANSLPVLPPLNVQPSLPTHSFVSKPKAFLPLIVVNTVTERIRFIRSPKSHLRSKH